VPYRNDAASKAGEEMSSETDVSSRYLALALDARKIIDALILFIDRKQRVVDLDHSLQEAIDSLRTVGKKAEVFSPARSRLAFSEYYEQVRTVEEALAPEEIERIVASLSRIKAHLTYSDNQKEDARQAIKLLSAIESRALHYYRPQP